MSPKDIISVEGHYVHLEPDRILYIGPNVIATRVERKAQWLAEEGKTVHVHYHAKKQAECNEDCKIIRAEDD